MNTPNKPATPPVLNYRPVGRYKIDLKLRGLGDAVKAVTDKLGIPQCGWCKDRQEWLNEKFPFKP